MTHWLYNVISVAKLLLCQYYFSYSIWYCVQWRRNIVCDILTCHLKLWEAILTWYHWPVTQLSQAWYWLWLYWLHWWLIGSDDYSRGWLFDSIHWLCVCYSVMTFVCLTWRLSVSLANVWLTAMKLYSYWPVKWKFSMQPEAAWQKLFNLLFWRSPMCIQYWLSREAAIQTLLQLLTGCRSRSSSWWESGSLIFHWPDDDEIDCIVIVFQ